MRAIETIRITTGLIGLLAVSSPAIAVPSGYSFTTIVVPGSLPGTTAGFGYLGINDLGQIVGDFTDNAGTHGFLYRGGKFTTINPPGATFTVAIGINDRGQVLGSSDSSGTFLYTHGTFTLIASLSTAGFPFGINNLSQIVGGGFPGGSGPDGFVYTRGKIKTFAVPGALSTAGYAINDFGQIVGNYQDSMGFHAFLDKRGTFTEIAVPGSFFTIATGVNDRGQIVGGYCDATLTICSSFLDTNGDFTTIDVPGSTFTNALGINNLDQVVGVYGDSNGLFNAFLATPLRSPTMSAADPPIQSVPEPSSLVLATIGLIGLGFVRRRKASPSRAAGRGRCPADLI